MALVPSSSIVRRLLTRAAPAATLAATSVLAAKSNDSGSWTDADAAAQKTRDEWSSVVGWISIACWVIVYSPQLKENYDRKSGEGLSIAFVVIWLAGDALNLIGAWRQELLWTMIILAGYYTLCDIALIFQYYYYRKWQDYYHPALESSSQQPSETTPLVPTNSNSDQNKGAEGDSTWKQEVLRYLGAAGVVVATGVGAWAIQRYFGSDSDDNNSGQKPEGPGWRWDAQIYGWLSAVLYLMSRVPQIFKNRQTKCEGLSLALFLFAVAGNVTYVASILIKSMEQEYLVESASWLVGSVGTVFLDFVVLGQFVAYREERIALASAASGGASGIQGRRSSFGDDRS
ncbi:unnamed protein product [Jaminaea pallidilutea]